MAKMKVTKKLLADFHEHNKLMKRVGASQKTLEEYLKYISGKLRTKPKLIKEPMKSSTYRRESPRVQSGDGIAYTPKNIEPKQYAGERKLLGIACMHKSNLVPVFDQSDAEDISKMRRN